MNQDKKIKSKKSTIDNSNKNAPKFEQKHEETKEDVGHDTHSMWEDAVKKHKEEQSKGKKKESLFDKLFNKDTLCDYKIYSNINRHIFKSAESNGRIYLPFHYMSKEYRSALRLDGQRLKEIYEELIKKGYVSSVQEAFDKYLIKAYDKTRKVNKNLTYQECINLILNSGGIPVLAHPHSLELDNEKLEKLLRKMIKLGLKGIEVYHSSHSPEEMQMYLERIHH